MAIVSFAGLLGRLSQCVKGRATKPSTSGGAQHPQSPEPQGKLAPIKTAGIGSLTTKIHVTMGGDVFDGNEESAHPMGEF